MIKIRILTNFSKFLLCIQGQFYTKFQLAEQTKQNIIGYVHNNQMESLKHNNKIIIETLKKFKFTTVVPAILCRQNIYNILTKYGSDSNNLFNEATISGILKDQFKLSSQSIAKCLSAITKYDLDNDFKLNAMQLGNFITEYIFGEIQLQNNKLNYLNESQFVTILTHALLPLNIQLTVEEFQNIFTDIDQKRTKSITKQDYLQFLKDYFGSESHAAILVDFGGAKNIQQGNQTASQIENKIARLIFSQLKIIFMKYDFTRSLNLTIQQSKVLLAQVFGFVNEEQQQFLAKYYPKAEALDYQSFMKNVIIFYVCDVFFRGDNRQLMVIKAGTFVEVVHKALYFVKVKPSPYDLQYLYLSKSKLDPTRMTRTEYIQMMKKIFLAYSFQHK